jgi:hypothetical protein
MDEYCRSIESYLCRKNDGHLIRIVGPAFDRVCDWAEKGVPLKVVYRGIDRCFERYYAKGARRRPVRVEFCEADVLEVFDEWRRAVGVLVARERLDPGDGPEGAETDREDGAGQHRGSLPAHLDRGIARLTALRGASAGALAGAVETALGQLDTMRGVAKHLRGEARRAAFDRLRHLDAALLAAAREEVDAAALQAIQAEAEVELAPFRARMPAEAYERAHAACVHRIIRERARLPTLSLD